MFVVDAHLDMAFAALGLGYDLRQPLETIRAAQPNVQRTRDGVASVNVQSLIDGGVGLALATLFVMPRTVTYAYSSVPEHVCYADDAPLDYRQNQAHAAATRQLDYYHRLADADDRVVLVKTQADLARVEAAHGSDKPLLGLIIHMEGAEPIRDPGELEMWYARGLRSIGLAWDDTRYAPGQWREAGKLPADGYRLLERMMQYNMLCDITHMSEKASIQVLEMYEGAVAATHCNARALVPLKRLLTDTQIQLLGERGGMIGAVLFNHFLRKEHAKGDPKQFVTLDHVFAHIDHICQTLGDADHIGIGSDMDGGFGAQDIPLELNSSRDLPKIAVMLRERGYDQASVEAIMGNNWLRQIRQILP